MNCGDEIVVTKKVTGKQAKSKTELWRYLLGGLLLSLVVLAALVWSAWASMVRPLDLGSEGLRFEVTSGSGLIQVLRALERKEVLQRPRLVQLYAHWQGKSSIHPGEYLLPAGSNAMDLVERLHRGDVTRYRVTLVEGWTFRQALDQVRAARKIVHTEAAADPASAARALGIEDNPEGWIFPDTYIYRSGTSDIELLRQAHQRMQQVLEEEWQNRAEALPYESPYEALIMASIVEKETGQVSEQGDIAGVFVRRLNRGMRLQTDPTVIYGMGDEYEGRLRRSHLRESTPYNTYVIHGLPPTPIALPGRGAIHAALNPRPGDSLFFVAKGDGYHHFSATLAEHNRAVQRYQLNRGADYRSTPLPQQAPAAEDN